MCLYLIMYLVEVVKSEWIDLDKVTRMRLLPTGLKICLDDGTDRIFNRDGTNMEIVAKNLATLTVQREHELGGCNCAVM